MLCMTLPSVIDPRHHPQSGSCAAVSSCAVWQLFNLTLIASDPGVRVVSLLSFAIAKVFILLGHIFVFESSKARMQQGKVTSKGAYFAPRPGRCLAHACGSKSLQSRSSTLSESFALWLGAQQPLHCSSPKQWLAQQNNYACFDSCATGCQFLLGLQLHCRRRVGGYLGTAGATFTAMDSKICDSCLWPRIQYCMCCCPLLHITLAILRGKQMFSHGHQLMPSIALGYECCGMKYI
jgi:hypothetical protein